MFTIRLLAILVVMSLSSVGAVTIHVPQDQPTIQAGIDAAGYRDTVLVAPGTYLENVSFLGKAIVLVSSGGRDVTFIEQALAGAPIVTFSGGENSLTILDGFTIRNATGNCGIFCYYADPIIQNCDVSFCLSPSDGVGIYCQGSGATIRYNLIHDNHGAGTGGGIGGKTSAGLEVAHNSIYSNSCPNGPGIGLIAPTAHVQIHHNLFFRNNVGYKGLNSSLYINGADCEILNNTFVENTGGIKLLNGAGTTILNNIIVSNEQSGIDPAAAFVDYNDVWNNGSANDPGPNGISVDPLFTEPLTNDYTLQATSPCVDAGDPDPQYNDPDGTRNDMGAFPITILPNLPVPLNLNLGVEENLHVVSHTPTFFWTFYDTAGTQAAYTLEVGTDDEWSMSEMWVSGEVMSTDTFALYAGSTLNDGETYYYRARLSNESGWGDWREASFRMNSFPIPPIPIFPVGQASVNSNGCQLWVLNSTDADDDNLTYDFEVYGDPGMSTLVHGDSLIPERADSTKSGTVFELVIGAEYWWRCRSFDCYEYSAWSSVESFVTNAASVINVPEDQPTIQDGIDQAASGDTVFVNDGVYIGESNRNIDFNGKNIVLKSRGGAEATIIDCQQAGRAFYFHSGEDLTAKLEGFTVLNGRPAHGGCSGGAVLCESSSPTIRDCIFAGNSVGYYM